MVRYASGAYVTSPITAIMSEAGTLPFDLLVLQGVVRVGIRMMEKDQGNVNLPVVQRVSERLIEIGLELPNIAVRPRLGDRIWHEPKPRIVWDVKRRVKTGDPPCVVRHIVQELLAERFDRATVVYTNGSKDNNSVGAGVYSDNLQSSIGLLPMCSVFSAEAFAIKSALNISLSDLVIMSDSVSCLSAIEKGSSQHPWIQEIELQSRNRSIQFCWIPCHAGIRGNDLADFFAGEARNNPPFDVAVPRRDAVKAIGEAIRQQWETQWAQLLEVKLREIKTDTRRWSDQRSAADQRVLTRLRIGHTRLTHEFLLKKSSPPVCDCCGTVVDVRHIILQCRKYDAARSKYKIDPTSLRAALCNDADREKQMLAFLQETGLYQQL